jgi:hypothetical protein
MAITAINMSFIHAGIMQRVVDEAEYVLTVLNRMRDEVVENRELYDLNAREQIEEAIARVKDVLREAQVMVCGEEQNRKAA